MDTYQVRIEGFAPLLQHRFFGADEPESKGRRRTGVPDWKADAEKSLYRTPEGIVYQPAEHIESAMTKAAANYKIPGKRNKTYKDLIRTSVIIDPQAIPHVFQEWEIENGGRGRPVIVQRARVIRYRPQLDTWALEFSLNILDDELAASVVLDILHDAGRRVGIGDYRPKFGRFQVTKWEKQG